MKLGICTIQRDRAPWIMEWIAFHYLVGFRNFYFFAHRCTDQTLQTIAHLQKRIGIKVFLVPDDTDRPQLSAYQYAYNNFGDEVDWMAFIDGDEFLFPTQSMNIGETLHHLDDGFVSAFGVCWACFGSSNFIIEPPGLITENYRYRAPNNFEANTHIKSIVRGGLGDLVKVSVNAHLFKTPNGTFDENIQLITSGKTQYSPTWNHLRINHYVCQSRNYFTSFKQMSGSADLSAKYVRPEEWWIQHDRNDTYDKSLENYFEDLKKIVHEFSCK